jgi:DNA-binding NarL/FixJ family response regulator
VRELHNAQPNSIPVVVLTASVDSGVRDLALKAGASEVLTTEASFEEILQVVRLQVVRRIAEEY